LESINNLKVTSNDMMEGLALVLKKVMDWYFNLRTGYLDWKFPYIFSTPTLTWSRNSAVSIATGFWLDNRGMGVLSPGRVNNSLLHVVQTGSGAYTASYPIYIGVKRPRREADHSPSTSAEVKKTNKHGSIYPLPHASSWRSA
jgi:hypothetical protein